MTERFLGIIFFLIIFTVSLFLPQPAEGVHVFTLEPPESQAKFSSDISKTVTQQALSVQPLVSVYFYNLIHYKAYGFDENREFTPASLLKLPVMLGVYKAAEQNTELLTAKVTVPERVRNQVYYQNIPPKQRVSIGKTYTLEELLRYTSEYSDNIALQTVGEYLVSKNIDPLRDVYAYFRLDENKMSGYGDIISSKQYAQFLITLYKKSYLQPQSSQKVLRFLSNAEFAQGLRAGVPRTIRVAHKFGERRYSNSRITQLHDCGIVYHPKSPFVLCVMTKGNDLKQQERAIASITKEIYEDVEKGRL